MTGQTARLMNASGRRFVCAGSPDSSFQLRTSTETNVVIIIPGDPERARQAIEQRRQREEEEAARRSLEVSEAIEKHDVVLMAALWLERRGQLTSDRCDECVRDMNLLTPELAHAANEESLPYDAILLVRTLKGSKSLFSATPIIHLLSGASLQIEKLRFAIEARQRETKRRSQTATPDVVVASVNRTRPPEIDGAASATPAPNAGTTTDVVVPGRPAPSAMLRPKQLPAQVLVTLLVNGVPMLRQDLQHRFVRNKKNDNRLANLMTPNGDLAQKGLIDASGNLLSLTDAGRGEAEIQRQLGTLALGEAGEADSR